MTRYISSDNLLVLVLKFSTFRLITVERGEVNAKSQFSDQDITMK